MKNRIWSYVLVAACFTGVGAVGVHAVQEKKEGGKVYELRTYTTHPGKLDALNARFRDHTTRLFEKHGMKNVGYWVPTDGEKAQNTLIYVLEHESREAADQSFKAFGADPEWRKAAADSEKDGKIVAKLERVFMKATDYSKLK